MENIGVPVRAVDDEEWMRRVRDAQKYSELWPCFMQCAGRYRLRVLVRLIVTGGEVCRSEPDFRTGQ